MGRGQSSLQIELRGSLVQYDVVMYWVPLTTSSSTATFTSPISAFSSCWTKGIPFRRPVSYTGSWRVSQCLEGIFTKMPSLGEPRTTGVIGGGEETGEEPLLDLCSANCQVPEARNLKLFRKLSHYLLILINITYLKLNIISMSWLSYDYLINLLACSNFFKCCLTFFIKLFINWVYALVEI
jgi:hypothetical protein